MFLRKFVILMKFVFLRKFVILRKFVFLMSKVNRVGEAGEENIQKSGWDTPTGSRTMIPRTTQSRTTQSRMRQFLEQHKLECDNS